MTEQITVFVNDKPVRIYRGMLVKHALIACDYALYRSAICGEVVVVDNHGFRLGLEGALQEGSIVFTRPSPQGPFQQTR
jgi:hypothetical protein